MSLHSVTVRFGEHVVLGDVTLAVRPGESVGVIGDNGSGKSTLLRLMAGVLQPDDGRVIVAAPGGLGYLTQTLGLPGSATVADAIEHGLRDLRDLERRMRFLERNWDADGAAEEYAELTELFEIRGGYDAEARVEIALHGLGRPGLDRARRLDTLPGGDVARLGLAAVLASRPQLLLLDEPTNDLDDEALGWLEEHLRAYRGTLVAVTHDRVFLEQLTSTVLEVDGDAKAVRRHGNGYDGYLAAKAAERANQIQRYEQWKAEYARQAALLSSQAERLSAIPRKMDKAGFGGGPFRARSRTHGAMGRIRNAKEELRRLTADPVPPPPEPLRLMARFDGESGGDPVVRCVDVVVRGRLHLPELSLDPGDRLLVTGPNGAGKSTLLKVVAGELAPDSGTAWSSDRLGYLRQHDTVADGTVLSAFADGLPGTPDEHADLLLSLGLFRPEDLRRSTRTLSIGQRRRIELARLMRHPSEVILLDEPTNHLAPDLVEQLESALAEYAGAVIMVTHDRRIRRTFTGRRLHLDRGDVVAANG
ncbi:macrolide transport system ATP-binding/permease protein [Hamadaea flava]|nr:ABC-F family ATP-binding cassette domain-containing protein [Hamadaea flava]MCP2329281.1 macrolide transport system ATP-binding/permease protein [Hamadaea flava]